jgi:glycosyltransferase involved in cell wall biosynthesis
LKLFFLVSSLDLTRPFSATPAWWQLLKGLYEIGVEVVAAPYQGAAMESLWWRAAQNPAKLPGDLYLFARDTYRASMLPLIRRVMSAARRSPQTPDQYSTAEIAAALNEPSRAAKIEYKRPIVNVIDEPLTDKLSRITAQAVVAPLWMRYFDDLLRREKDFDAIIILTAPLNHLVGLAEAIQRKHGIPVLYYDGDVPASLPWMRGFDSGFRIYQGANLREYAAFISNSEGGGAMLSALGAQQVHTLYYGVDPDLFAPLDVPAQDIDLFFYGHGREYRDQWIKAMIAQPARAMPEARFAVRGTKLGDLGRVELLPYLSFSKLREYACRSKINLCITRAAHASVFASSSSRPFELASMGACIVSNPYLGIETWFEPGRELFVVGTAEEAIDRYRYLLSHDTERRAAGEAARARVLKQHTHRHRARELVQIVRQYARS